MAPLHLASWAASLVALALGFGFGFFIERGGLGNARKLTVQFYLHDMSVLKVMFTAIVTAMVLIFGSSALGLLELNAVWVNPTYLCTGVIGGLLLGVGFIVGGYCPGTSLVAAATGKIDGVVYVVGAVAGMALFGETVPLYWAAWHNWGAMGRFTLPELLGVEAGVVVVAVVLLALGMFWFAHWVEAWMGELPVPTPRARRGQVGGALALGGAAALVLVLGQPTTDDKVARRQVELDAAMASREYHLDPAEVVDIMAKDKMPLWLLDVRGDAVYNRFHLAGSRRLPADLRAFVEDELPDKTVIVLVADDDATSEAAWRRLTAEGGKNLYLLDGGLERWFEIYGAAHGEGAEHSLVHTLADLPYAVGARHPAARPLAGHQEPREYTPKVKLKGPSGGGGCG